MDKVKDAINHVLQCRAYYEQCGQQITDDDEEMFKNDAANLFSESYEEYCDIWNALLEV
jgi:hypothetical protein